MKDNVYIVIFRKYVFDERSQTPLPPKKNVTDATAPKKKLQTPLIKEKYHSPKEKGHRHHS